ncbi:LapA family protein [Pantoea sp. Aalb]|uniref:LapA family protein n=1 Tax=Pantoea sp. Aalb TaxID=2576762 RepID=UPI001325ADD2|nr:lipopolysaccharide assembly protein LapA domain-containing protein [Pantoea sp. Aalb]MXP67400.1 DUF1049 domain-containing protein [Pantoea sp. Aalb]
MKSLLIFFVILVIFIISVILGAQNNQVITFNFLFAKIECQISTLLACLFSAGFMLGWTICGFFWLRTRLTLSNVQRKLKRIKAQQNII